MTARSPARYIHGNIALGRTNHNHAPGVRQHNAVTGKCAWLHAGRGLVMAKNPHEAYADTKFSPKTGDVYDARDFGRH
jgi:hypothetical protein